MLSVVSVLGSKKVLNKPKDQKPALSVKRLSAAESTALGEELNRVILRLYGQFLSEDGRHVKYTELGHSDLFKQYQERAETLGAIDMGALSVSERKALCLNVYNMLLIHAFVVLGPPSNNTASRLQFFNSATYILGGADYSLFDIENGLLRGNRKFLGSKPFKKGDPRRAVALSGNQVDERIHFGLVCGAESCPPIRIFTSANLDTALDMAAKSFCNDSANVLIDVKKKAVSLSMIFKWYAEDFGKDERSVLRYVLKHTSGEQREKLQALLDGQQLTVCYLDYSWKLNE